MKSIKRMILVALLCIQPSAVFAQGIEFQSDIQSEDANASSLHPGPRYSNPTGTQGAGSAGGWLLFQGQDFETLHNSYLEAKTGLLAPGSVAMAGGVVPFIPELDPKKEFKHLGFAAPSRTVTYGNHVLPACSTSSCVEIDILSPCEYE